MPPPLALRAATPGAVSACIDLLGGRRVVRVAVDGGAARRGALTVQDGETFTGAVHQALDARLPLVAVLASSGADVGAGVAALHGWGTIARALSLASGTIPLIAIVTGPTVSGPALLLGLADLVLVTADAYAFVSGPRMVAQMTGTTISPAELGGAAVHARSSGVAALIADDLEDALGQVAAVLALLPDHTDVEPPRWRTGDSADRSTPEAGALLPDSASGSYDVRSVVACVVDDGDVLELRAAWAPNLVTALATIDGRPVGIVANQPCAIAGTLDIAASQKGARFVAFCDAFNLPLVTLIDTPGFSPGKDLEWRGMIRHGAQLAFAYARATVPRVSITLRKSYGGAYIVMDSKEMGNDLALAWPTAQIAVMGAKGAAEILHRGADPAARAAAEASYEERLLNPWIAAERGLLDAVIDPADTRRELCAALDLLSTKHEPLVRRAHDNMPL